MLIFFAFVLGLYYCIDRSKKGKIPTLRSIPALDAIPEAIGRAVEMGGAVHYTSAMGFLVHAEGPQTIASISILGHVARLCARLGARLIVTIMNPQIIPMTTSVVEQAYMVEGKMEDYNEDDIRFLSNTQQAFVSGVMGILERENVKANLDIGICYAETLQIFETGSRVGAIQIGGTARVQNLAFIVAVADYALLGEELYAAAAYVSKEPVLLGSILAQDVAKVLTIATLVIGFIMISAGIDIINKILLI
jgi:hypothetical protein